MAKTGLWRLRYGQDSTMMSEIWPRQDYDVWDMAKTGLWCLIYGQDRTMMSDIWPKQDYDVWDMAKTGPWCPVKVRAKAWCHPLTSGCQHVTHCLWISHRNGWRRWKCSKSKSRNISRKQRPEIGFYSRTKLSHGLKVDMNLKGILKR